MASGLEDKLETAENMSALMFIMLTFPILLLNEPCGDLNLILELTMMIVMTFMLICCCGEESIDFVNEEVIWVTEREDE